MAKITARIDFLDSKWESKEMVSVFQNGTDEEKRSWMLDNCKCEEESINLDGLFYYDEKLTDNKSFLIYYADLGFVEEVVLIDY